MWVQLDRVKPSFVIFDIRALWRSGLKAERSPDGVHTSNGFRAFLNVQHGLSASPGSLVSLMFTTLFRQFSQFNVHYTLRCVKKIPPPRNGEYKRLPLWTRCYASECYRPTGITEKNVKRVL